MTVAAGTVVLKIIFKGVVDDRIDDDGKVASSIKTYTVQDNSAKPTPYFSKCLCSVFQVAETRITEDDAPDISWQRYQKTL